MTDHLVSPAEPERSVSAADPAGGAPATGSTGVGPTGSVPGEEDDEEFVERWFREDPPADEPTRPKLRLRTEAVIIVALYAAYTFVRNSQGTNLDARAQAFTNAKRIIRAERWIGMYQEESIQDWFLRSRPIIQFLNGYYGIAHFVVTIAAMVWCFRKRPWRYRSIRNGLALMTWFALIGFKFFPLMPPRLLPKRYGYVDTLEVIGSPWNFKSGPVAQVSNQFAAMPSLHFGWAAWCAVAFWPWATTWPRKVLLLAYPLLTLVAIVATANHYILDALGGFAVFTIGMRLGTWLDRVDWSKVRARLQRRTA
jgi:PAP2 superfamily